MRRALVPAVILAALLGVSPVLSADLRVLTAGAFKPIVLAVGADFEKQSGHRLIIDNDTAGGLVKRIEGGEAFDIVLIPPGAGNELIGKGKVVSGTLTNLARTSIGVAVKDGAPKPAIASVADFKAALLAAGKVAYIDPASGGSSGIYFSKLLETMGIAEAVRAKAVLVPGGLVAQRLVTGEADLAVHQISEILAVPGATLVGPLPSEIQSYTVYAGGIATAAVQPEAARAFLAFLGSDAAKAVLTSRGLEAAPK